MKYSILAILLAAVFSFAQETVETQTTEAPAAAAQEVTEPQAATAPAEASQEVAEPVPAEPQAAAPAAEAPAQEAAPAAETAPAPAPAAAAPAAPAAVAAPEPVESDVTDVDLSAEPSEPRRVDAGIDTKPTKQDWLLYTGIAASVWSLISLCGFSAFDEEAMELYEDSDPRSMTREHYEKTRSKIKHKQKWRDIWGMNAAISAGVVALTWIPWAVINF